MNHQPRADGTDQNGKILRPLCASAQQWNKPTRSKCNMKHAMLFCTSVAPSVSQAPRHSWINISHTQCRRVWGPCRSNRSLLNMPFMRLVGSGNAATHLRVFWWPHPFFLWRATAAPFLFLNPETWPADDTSNHPAPCLLAGCPGSPMIRVCSPLPLSLILNSLSLCFRTLQVRLLLGLSDPPLPPLAPHIPKRACNGAPQIYASVVVVVVVVVVCVDNGGRWCLD
jgi:hypothetical protein